MVHDNVIDYNSILSFSLKSDGSPLVFCRTAPVTKRVKNRPTLVPGDIQAYNITDALSSVGTITVNQGTNPWTVGGSLGANLATGTLTALEVLPVVSTAAAPTLTEGKLNRLSEDLSGNLRIKGQTALPPGYASFNNLAQASSGVVSFLVDVIVKSLVITTSATAGNRTLVQTVSAVNYPLSTKSVAPSTTGDLLDREIVMSKNTSMKILGWDSGGAGDLGITTFLQVI